VTAYCDGKGRDARSGPIPLTYRSRRRGSSIRALVALLMVLRPHISSSASEAFERSNLDGRWARRSAKKAPALESATEIR